MGMASAIESMHFQDLRPSYYFKVKIVILQGLRKWYARVYIHMWFILYIYMNVDI